MTPNDSNRSAIEKILNFDSKNLKTKKRTLMYDLCDH